MKTKHLIPMSPLTLARSAMAEARQALPLYSHKFSRRDYTQHQLYALLALRDFLHTDYRRLEHCVREWSDLRGELGLHKAPDHSTLHRAAKRLRERRESRDVRQPMLPGLDVP